MPARKQSRGVRRVRLVAVALVLVVSGCSLGGGDDEAQDAGGETGAAETGAAETGPDVVALRAAWADEVGAACRERNTEIEPLARGLPDVVEQNGLAAAAAQFETVNQPMLERIDAAEPAPGDEEKAQEMADYYQEALQSEEQAVGTRYVRRDRTFDALMRESEAAREQAAAIATELGAEGCVDEPAGPYASAEGLAAVRWGYRASTLCRERDRAYMRLRPTDIARFDAVTRRWLRATRALASPDQYARRIDRFLDMYAESERAYKEGLTEKGNRLSSESTRLMYDIGFEIGFTRFCSAKPQ